MSDDEIDFDDTSDMHASDFVRHGNSHGMIVNKSQLSLMTGLAIVTLDRCFANGAPVEFRGTRKQGWRINTAAFFGWYWRQKVEEVTGDPDAQTFDVAKRREKEAQAKLKELDYRKRVGELIPIDRAVAIYQEDAAVQRSRLLAIPASLAQDLAVEEDPAEVEAKITDALNDALGDISGDKRETYTDDSSTAGDYADDEDFDQENPFVENVDGESPDESGDDSDGDFDFG